MEKIKQNLETLKEYFTQQGVAFRCDDKSGLILYLKINDDDMEALVQVSGEMVDIQVCYVKESPENPFIKEALEESYPEMSDYLNKVNQILKEGAFEIERGKSVSYRISFPVEEVQISAVWDACFMKDWIWTEILNIMNGCSAEEMFLQTMVGVVKDAKKSREEYIAPEINQIIVNDIVPEIERAIMECIG